MAELGGSDKPTIGGRTWFTIDGTIEPIAFDGASFFRFPEELAKMVIQRFSEPGDLARLPA
jgi:hypothetical protein